MRAWFVWGLMVCCAASASGSWAQECEGDDPVDRTVVELQRHQARLGDGVRASGDSGGRSFDVGAIAVLEDDGAGELIYRTRGGDMTLDVVAVARRFYRSHGDDFDFLTLFTSFPIVDPGTESPFSAYSLVVNNDVRGIHMANFDYSGDFGSAGNLEAIVNMNNWADLRYLRGPYDRLPGNNDSTMSLLAHETGHRWGARVQVDEDPGPRIRRSDILLGRQLSHWSFYLHAPSLMGASSLEGNYWQFNGDGTFSSMAETDGYSALDQYLMGLMAADEVPPFFVVDGQHARSAGDAPVVGYREIGFPRWFTARDIITVEGRRVAGRRTASGAWRQAFVLVVPKGYPDTEPAALQALIERLDAIRQEWEYYFFESTEGRGTMHTSLENEPSALHRLYSTDSGMHFYTTSDVELFFAIAYEGFVWEGTVGRLFATQAAGTLPLYRLFNPRTAKHFYTTDPFEREGVILRERYVPEGVTGYLYAARTPGTLPVYRMFHYWIADHFYTSDPGEVRQAERAGYVMEGIIGYVFPDGAFASDSP